MGYNTNVDGILKFAQPLTAEQQIKLQSMLGEDPDDHPEWFAPKPNSYLQWDLAKDLSGIEWDGNEKFYYICEGLNIILDVMRKDFPDFGFESKGQLRCQGEEFDDRWIVGIIDGKAARVDVTVKSCECPECGHKWEAA